MHLKDTLCDKNMQSFDFALLKISFWNVVILQVLSVPSFDITSENSVSLSKFSSS